MCFDYQGVVLPAVYCAMKSLCEEIKLSIILSERIRHDKRSFSERNINIVLPDKTVSDK